MCVLGLGFWLRPATPGWGVGVCVSCVRAPLVPRHYWLGCAVPLCVFGLGFWLRPATPGWDVGVCVCWSAHSACAPSLLARVWGVCVCVLAQVSAAPCHSWLGCWRLCVFVCALRLYPATPGRGVPCRCVCLGSGFGCAPSVLAGVMGCVCVFARSACTPPLLAGTCGAGVCAWARVWAAPRHCWLGCSGACVYVCALRLYPATSGWGVRCVCVCVFGLEFLAAPRHCWQGCWGVYVLVCALRLCSATPGWGVRCGCVCFSSGFGCALPLLAGLLGHVCLGVRIPLVPHHSWVGCAPWVCVDGLGLRLRPATPGWGVGVCVCFRALSACTPPFLAGVCGMSVCAWAPVWAAPRHSWLGCWGVCVYV